MGEVLFHTGLALKVIDGVERLIRQVRVDSPWSPSSRERFLRHLGIDDSTTAMLAR